MQNVHHAWQSRQYVCVEDGATFWALSEDKDEESSCDKYVTRYEKTDHIAKKTKSRKARRSKNR